MEQQPGLSERKDRCRPVTGFLGAAWCGGSPARKVAHQQRLDCKLNSKGVNTSYNVQKRVIPIRQSADNLFISQRLCVIQNEEVPLLSTGSPVELIPAPSFSLHFTSFLEEVGRDSPCLLLLGRLGRTVLGRGPGGGATHFMI